ncbi:MAG: hypothetical protein J3Q66DRAFT_354656 [Benniella sp.]|nr:MAG: hypothetical protein J3Q66DRAFT_354656 [Benniella sp.]
MDAVALSQVGLLINMCIVSYLLALKPMNDQGRIRCLHHRDLALPVCAHTSVTSTNKLFVFLSLAQYFLKGDQCVCLAPTLATGPVLGTHVAWSSLSSFILSVVFAHIKTCEGPIPKSPIHNTFS